MVANSNAPHGFDNSLRAGYDAVTVNLARERTLDFLAEHVGSIGTSSYLTYQSFKQEILGISPTIDDHHHVHSIVVDAINDSPRGDQQLAIEVQAYVAEFGNDTSSCREGIKRLRSFAQTAQDLSGRLRTIAGNEIYDRLKILTRCEGPTNLKVLLFWHV